MKPGSRTPPHGLKPAVLPQHLFQRSLKPTEIPIGILRLPSRSRAKGGVRTHDLLLTKKARYRCATSAGPPAGIEPAPTAYETVALPLCYGGRAPLPGFEPRTVALTGRCAAVAPERYGVAGGIRTRDAHGHSVSVDASTSATVHHPGVEPGYARVSDGCLQPDGP